MTKHPSISIVTPSYDQVRFLGDALTSVRCQRYEGRVEHIVIDGGSSDGSVELMASLPGLVWVSEPDEGQSDALNKGFERATGDIIGWLNSDDFYLEGAFEVIADVFDRYPNVDVVFGDCVFVDSVGRATRLKAEHAYSRLVLRYVGCFIPSTATFFRRRLVEDGMLRLRNDLHYVMDYELFMRLDSAGVQMRWVGEDLAAFRWHEENKSLDATRRIHERELVQTMYDVWPKSSRARRAAYTVVRPIHLLMKLFSGALGRQFRWRWRRGESLTWWGSECR